MTSSLLRLPVSSTCPPSAVRCANLVPLNLPLSRHHRRTTLSGGQPLQDSAYTSSSTSFSRHQEAANPTETLRLSSPHPTNMSTSLAGAGAHTTTGRFRHILVTATRHRASATATRLENLSTVIARSKHVLSIEHALTKQGHWIWAAFLFHLLGMKRQRQADSRLFCRSQERSGGSTRTASLTF